MILLTGNDGESDFDDNIAEVFDNKKEISIGFAG